MWRGMLLAGLLLCGGVLAKEAPQRIDGAQTVDLFQAVYLYQLGALFVDVRSADKWRWGHIDGAMHLPYAARFDELADPGVSRDLPLVIYCDSEICADGPGAVMRAVAWGYRQVFYFRGGYFVWQLADLPLSQTLDEAPPLNAAAR